MDAFLTYKTAWYAAMRVRCAMVDCCNIEPLENIVEMDESYIGGKSRKRYVKGKDNKHVLSSIDAKKGRGTKKIPVVGIVECGDKVVLKVIEKLTAQNLLVMLKEYVKTDSAVVVSGEFSSHKSFNEVVQHFTVDHGKEEICKKGNAPKHHRSAKSFVFIVRI